VAGGIREVVDLVPPTDQRPFESKEKAENGRTSQGGKGEGEVIKLFTDEWAGT